MKLKTSFAACAIALAISGSAQAQSAPSVAAAWGQMNLAQAGCLERGTAALKRLNFQRIEAISFTVYGDHGKFQLGIRCVPDKQMYFVFGGGPGDDEKPLLDHINAVKAEIDRSN
jgi:hypothetical protein